MNKKIDSSRILDILIQNSLLEQITWNSPEDKTKYQTTSMQNKSDKQQGLSTASEKLKITGATNLFDKKTGLATQDFKNTNNGWNFYKNGRVHDNKGRRGNYKFNASTSTLDITWDKKKYGEAKGIPHWVYAIIIAAIGVGLGKFGARPLMKFLTNKGITLRYLMKGGFYKEAWQRFRGKDGKVFVEDGIEKLHSLGKITREERDEMLTLIKNDPEVAIKLETEYFQSGLNLFMKGGKGAPTVDEFLASLSEKLRKKYGEQIKKIEQERKQGISSKVKTKKMSNITPTAVKSTYSKISGVTGDQFDKVINGTKAQSILNDFRAQFGNVTTQREIEKLKNVIISGKASKINKNFKTRDEFETFITKTTPNVKLTQQIELEWMKYQLKRLFK